MQEPTLIKLGYAIEQTINARVAPTLSGAVPPDPPLFPGCDMSMAGMPMAPSTDQGSRQHGMHGHHPRHW
jgi:hypothetical protein